MYIYIYTPDVQGMMYCTVDVCMYLSSFSIIFPLTSEGSILESVQYFLCSFGWMC